MNERILEKDRKLLFFFFKLKIQCFLFLNYYYFRYKCKYCDKTFAQYGTKTVHEKSAHLGLFLTYNFFFCI